MLAFFTLSEPIWLSDMGTELQYCKKCFFYHFTPDFHGFVFFAAAKQTNKFELGQNLKLVLVAFGPICMFTIGFMKKI